MGGHELIAGERRWRAAQEAGLGEVPVIIRSASDRDVLELRSSKIYSAPI